MVKRKATIYYLIIFVVGIYYFYFLGERGYLLLDDSMEYIAGSSFVLGKYRLYIYFLRLFKTVFGTSNYLYVVYIVQSMFAFMTSFYTTENLRKLYNLNYFDAVVIYLMTLTPYAYTLPDGVSTHYILTEGLSFPFFTLLMLELYKLFVFRKKLSYMKAVGLSVLLVLTRSQMIMVLILICFIFCISLIQQLWRMGRYKRNLIWCLISVVLLSFSILGILFLNMMRQGKIPQFVDAITGKTLCLVEEQDSQLFEGEDREIFIKLYQEIDINHCRTAYFRNDLWRWKDIVESINTNTNNRTQPIIDFYTNRSRLDPSKDVSMDQIKAKELQIVYTLFAHHICDYIITTLQLLPQSFVAAIFIHPYSIYELCYGIAFFLYIVAIVMCVLLYSKKKEMLIQYIAPMIITLSTISILVIGTNLMFYGLQRYVVYAFGFFYIALYLLIIGFRKLKQFSKM